MTIEFIPIMITILGALGSVLLGMIVWGIKSLIVAVINNTKEIAVLNSKINEILKNSDLIPELQKDLNGLYDRVRAVEER